MRAKISSVIISLLTFVMVAGIPALAGAEEGEMFSPELFLIDTTFIQEKGELGIWLQPKYYNDDEGKVSSVDLSIEYGITDNLQIEVSYEGYKKIDPEAAGASSENGQGDLGAGIMYAFGDEDSSTRFAVGFEYTHPTGDFDKGLTEGYRVYEPFIAVSQSFEWGDSIHANLSYGIMDQQEKAAGAADEEENEVGISLAYIHPIADSLAFMFEAAVESNEWLADGEETEGMAGPALAWTSDSGIQIGTAFHFGLTDDSADWAVLFNIGKEFEFGDDD